MKQTLKILFVVVLFISTVAFTLPDNKKSINCKCTPNLDKIVSVSPNKKAVLGSSFAVLDLNGESTQFGGYILTEDGSNELKEVYVTKKDIFNWGKNKTLVKHTWLPTNHCCM